MQNLSTPPQQNLHKCSLCGCNDHHRCKHIGFRKFDRDRKCPPQIPPPGISRAVAVLDHFHCTLDDNGHCTHCQSCEHCGAQLDSAASVLLVGGHKHRLCKDCAPPPTGDVTLDAMIEAALCTTDPEVLRKATDAFAARKSIPLSVLKLTPVEHELHKA